MVERINYAFDESRSTTKMRYIIRKKTVRHRKTGYGTWTEDFEDSFTIPVKSIGWRTFLTKSERKSTDVTSTCWKSVTILRKNFNTFLKQDFFSTVKEKRLYIEQCQLSFRSIMIKKGIFLEYLKVQIFMLT
jgi:hypothetical protein